MHASSSSQVGLGSPMVLRENKKGAISRDHLSITLSFCPLFPKTPLQIYCHLCHHRERSQGRLVRAAVEPRQPGTHSFSHMQCPRVKPRYNGWEAPGTVLCGQKRWIRACSAQTVSGNVFLKTVMAQVTITLYTLAMITLYTLKGTRHIGEVSFSMFVNKSTHTLFKSCSFTYLHPWIKKPNLCSPRA